MGRPVILAERKMLVDDALVHVTQAMTHAEIAERDLRLVLGSIGIEHPSRATIRAAVDRLRVAREQVEQLVSAMFPKAAK